MSHFSLQVFPDETALSFPIDHTDIEDQGIINMTQLRTTVGERLETIVRRLIPEDDIEYSVRVLIEPEKLEKLADYNNLVLNEELSESLQSYLNQARQQKDLIFIVSLALFGEAYVVVTAALRDIARHYYTLPRAPLTVTDYDIDIYQGPARDATFMSQLQQYTSKVIRYNDALHAPLRMVMPLIKWQQPDKQKPALFVASKEFDDPLHLIFVARRQDRIIGYCGCVLLRYRSEVNVLMEKELEVLHAEDRRESYFMGAAVRHIFEVKGISVDQEEAGKNIGLLLLYYAMNFICHREVQRFFPVSHIVSQSASYITKRLLVSNFDFRYHGLNEFMNEEFIETLSDRTKEFFVRVITEFFSYNNLLFGHHRDALKQLLKDSTLGSAIPPTRSPVMLMIADIIRIYQLYYLLLKTTTRARAFDCYSRETANAIILTFNHLKTMLVSQRAYEPLRRYFDDNIISIELYSASKQGQLAPTAAAMSGFEMTIYTSKEYGEATMGRYKDFGFLKEPSTELVKHEIKEITERGYDMIYETVPNTIKVMQLLLQKLAQSGQKDEETESYTLMQNHINGLLSCINELVRSDLVALYNESELPLLQMNTIIRVIPLIMRALDEKPARFKQLRERQTLNTLDAQMKEKIQVMQLDDRFNRDFTLLILNVPSTETDGFDTFISHESLCSRQSCVNQRLKTKLGYVGEEEEEEEVCNESMLVEESSNNNDETAVCETLLSQLSLQDKEIPTQSDQLALEVIQIYEILITNPPDNTDIVFRGGTYTVRWLKEYFNRLVPLYKESSQEEMEMNVEEEEESAASSILTYNYSDFIDINYASRLAPQGVFNETLI